MSVSPGRRRFLSSIPRVLARGTFVAPLVVARDPSHELLGFRGSFIYRFLLELFSVIATQSRRQASPVENLDGSILAHAIGEAEIAGWRRFFHLSLVGERGVCFCKAQRLRLLDHCGVTVFGLRCL